MKRVSIQEIADNLKISRNTVSKALKNDDSVSYDTRQKVIKRAMEMGYGKIKPEIVRKMDNLHPNRTGNVAVIAHADYSDFWRRILNGISEELNKANCNLLYSCIGHEDEDNLVLPANIANLNVDGIIVLSVFKKQYIEVLIKTKIPITYFDAPVKSSNSDLQGDIILVDGERAIYEITRHLLENGNERLGFIGDITYCRTIYERWCGFKDALHEAGIIMDEDICFVNKARDRYYAYEDIYDALSKIEQMPQAFVCANDNIAAQAIKYLKSAGYKIPEDIAVTGFDDAYETYYVEPHLTTVHVYTEQLGRRLVEELFWRIRDPRKAFETIKIATDIKLNESSNRISVKK